MGLSFPATCACDRCGKRSAVRLEVTGLKPQPAMHLQLPDGWAVSSKPESGELLITCPACPAVLVSIPPPVVVTEAEVMDPATDPTLRPPPLPKV